MRQSVGRFSGVEFRRMGQFNRPGRYPLHWLDNGEATASSVVGCLVHRSYQRGIVTVGSRRVRICGNVVVKPYGHGYIVEAEDDSPHAGDDQPRVAAACRALRRPGHAQLLRAPPAAVLDRSAGPALDAALARQRRQPHSETATHVVVANVECDAHQLRVRPPGFTLTSTSTLHGKQSGEALVMSTFAGSGRRTRAMKPFWETNAFWFVGIADKPRCPGVPYRDDRAGVGPVGLAPSRRAGHPARWLSADRRSARTEPGPTRLRIIPPREE